MTLFLLSSMLRQGQLSLGWVKHLPTLPSPRKAQSILPNSFVQLCTFYMLTQTHTLEVTREEEILEGRGNSLLHSETLFCRNAFPATAAIERMGSFGTGLSLSHLLSFRTKVQHSLSGNITFFRLKKNNPNSGRNPTALYYYKQTESQVISLSIKTRQLLQAAKTPPKLRCCWWHTSTWCLAYWTHFGTFPLKDFWQVKLLASLTVELTKHAYPYLKAS